MKKVVLFAVSVLFVVTLASMSMAAGHDVGHVDVYEDSWDEVVEVTSEHIEKIKSNISSEDLGGGESIEIVNVTVTQTVKNDFEENIGDIDDMQNGEVTEIIAVVEIEIEHTGSFTGNVVLNFSGTPIADANYLWIKNESGKYDAFRMVNGIATIPQSVADNYFTKTKVFATYVEESSTTTTSGGGGGGGCNAGVVNPLMGLLALPLMWLLKK